MKQTGMLVVSLKGANFGSWFRLGCSAHSNNILSYQETELREEKQKSYFLFNLFCFRICEFLSGLF